MKLPWWYFLLSALLFGWGFFNLFDFVCGSCLSFGFVYLFGFLMKTSLNVKKCMKIFTGKFC